MYVLYLICHHIYYLLFALRAGVTGHRSQSRLLSLIPITVRALYFYPENVSALSSLVDATL